MRRADNALLRPGELHFYEEMPFDVKNQPYGYEMLI